MKTYFLVPIFVTVTGLLFPVVVLYLFLCYFGSARSCKVNSYSNSGENPLGSVSSSDVNNIYESALESLIVTNIASNIFEDPLGSVSSSEVNNISESALESLIVTNIASNIFEDPLGSVSSSEVNNISESSLEPFIVTNIASNIASNISENALLIQTLVNLLVESVIENIDSNIDENSLESFSVTNIASNISENALLIQTLVNLLVESGSSSDEMKVSLVESGSSSDETKVSLVESGSSSDETKVSLVESGSSSDETKVSIILSPVITDSQLRCKVKKLANGKFITMANRKVIIDGKIVTPGRVYVVNTYVRAMYYINSLTGLAHETCRNLIDTGYSTILENIPLREAESIKAVFDGLGFDVLFSKAKGFVDEDDMGAEVRSITRYAKMNGFKYSFKASRSFQMDMGLNIAKVEETPEIAQAKLDAINFICKLTRVGVKEAAYIVDLINPPWVTLFDSVSEDIVEKTKRQKGIFKRLGFRVVIDNMPFDTEKNRADFNVILEHDSYVNYAKPKEKEELDVNASVSASSSEINIASTTPKVEAEPEGKQTPVDLIIEPVTILTRANENTINPIKVVERINYNEDNEDNEDEWIYYKDTRWRSRIKVEEEE